MAAPAPKPIALTAGANPTPGADPQPFIVVGGLPAAGAARGGVLRGVAVADQAASTLPTDFPSTKVQIDAVITKLNALLASLRTAGVIAP